MSTVIRKEDVILKSRAGLVSKNISSEESFEKGILKNQIDSGIDDSVSKNTSFDKYTLEIKSGFGNVSKKDKVLELGPLESMFPCSESKILDFLVTFQEYDYSISDIAKHSGVGFKTTLGVVRNLEMQQVILNTRNVGRAKMYKLNLESSEGNGINKLALGIAATRAVNQVE